MLTFGQTDADCRYYHYYTTFLLAFLAPFFRAAQYLRIRSLAALR
jgi:hypothetical protein